MTQRPNFLACVAFVSALAPAALAQEAVPDSQIRGGLAEAPKDEAFERDREAILGMAGNFAVSFDFIETVSLQPDYELNERDTSSGTEMIRVLEDDGTYISLQHTLVMEVAEETFVVVKHWRQDWQYEPQSLMEFRGRGLWEAEPVDAAEADGAWSQTVYHVDDGPRYAALASWRHEGKNSTWEPDSTWRPLPQRDISRGAYDLIDGVNRHTVSPDVWWHEQNNSKLTLDGGAPQELVREIAVNTYTRSADFSVAAGETYWEKTGAFWAEVRAVWREAEATRRIAVHDTANGELLLMPMLDIASKLETGELELAGAVEQARALLDAQVQTGDAATQTAEAN